jgi:glycosyltransferase involved in cell wall biosynthesis
MRVLHINAGNLYGGIETLLVTLASRRSLCPGVEPEFALCFEGRLSKELDSSGVAVHLLGEARVSRPWTVVLARARLRQLLGLGGYDVVVNHGCWPHALFAPVARAAGLPVVFWAHDIAAARHWLERWAGWYPPDLVIANSRATHASLGALFPATRAEVLYLPVDAPSLPDRQTARQQVRSELGCPENAVVIVTACRLETWKGHMVLLEALGTLVDLPGWQWWLAGGAQRPAELGYLENLKKQVDARRLTGRVRFLGQRADVPRLLAAVDVHCQPNTGPEPFGIAFVEALYAGLPVLSTALGGALEIIDSSCGVLVPPGDATALAAALEGLMRDEVRRQRLRQAGPDRARHLCDPSRQLARLETILTGLACGRSEGRGGVTPLHRNLHRINS